jgi:26S proteasome regulatory subunit N13
VALQSGQLGPVLVQFGLPEDAIEAANQGDLRAFAQAMEKHYKKDGDKKPSENTMDTS